MRGAGRSDTPRQSVLARSLNGVARYVADVFTGGHWGSSRGGGYDAAKGARRLRGWAAPRLTINTLLADGGDTLRARARQLCRENPYAANAVEAFQAAAVGAGIKPSSLISDPEAKKAVQAAWTSWTDECDADGLTDLYGLQAMAARAVFEAGECFLQFVPQKPVAGGGVPLKLRMLESEMLDLSYNIPLPNGALIRNGIEFDADGQRIAYHFWRQHPGEFTLPGFDATRVRVPASEVRHIYKPIRPGQMRGQPGITPAMVRLYLLDQYDDAELDRKRVAAMFAGFITKPRPEDDGPIQTAAPDGTFSDAASAIATLEPGTMQVLLEGEDIKFSNPSEVGGSYEAFQWRQLLAIAAAAGVPYTDVTGDMSKSNYSSSRESQIGFRRRMDQFQHMVLVYQMCRPVWQRWMETAVLAKVVPISIGHFISDRKAMTAANWIPPKWDWVDPWKDRKAEELAVANGWKSRSDVIEAEGYDPEEVDQRIAADRAREKKLGLDFRPEADKQLDLQLDALNDPLGTKAA